MSDNKKKYLYNPHVHVKIWLSNKPDVFMNIENKVRLIAMRELNPTDTIQLVYDSSMLNKEALEELKIFSREHDILLVDAHLFEKELISEKERKLYQFYKDEITHLSEGGNLAAASDILRWLSPVYLKGVYTDFDVPVDTRKLPSTIILDSPLLLNIGRLLSNNKNFLLANNDCIAVVDPIAAKKDIEKVQVGIIKRLELYENEFIEKTIEEFGKDSVINKYLIQFMKNRSESIYISRSKSEFSQMGSRALRHLIYKTMTHSDLFLEFRRKNNNEGKKEIVTRLRKEQYEQLGFLKWLFFKSEYDEIKDALNQPDDVFVEYAMKRERTLYLKSIAICTTGPITIAKSLFNGHVFSSNYFDKIIEPYSFSNFGLQKFFRSKNTIPKHITILGMLSFLGKEEGSLNDSSWLETGELLQKSRCGLIEEERNKLCESLPNTLKNIKKGIETHISVLEKNSKGFWGLFFATRKREKLTALKKILGCFKNNEFDTTKFRSVLKKIEEKRNIVYAGWLFHRTEKLVKQLQEASNKAIVFMLTKNRKIGLRDNPLCSEIVGQKERKKLKIQPYYGTSLNFFQEQEKRESPRVQVDSRQRSHTM